MHLNIFAKFVDEIDHTIWVLSTEALSLKRQDRMEQAYLDTFCQLNSDNPILMQLVVHEPPDTGQIARDAFLCNAEDMELDVPLLINQNFWVFCVAEIGFIDTLGKFGEIMCDRETFTHHIEIWQKEMGLLCLSTLDKI